eukprot:6194982-Pyramimonas_sp.AAC.1
MQQLVMFHLLEPLGLAPKACKTAKGAHKMSHVRSAQTHPEVLKIWGIWIRRCLQFHSSMVLRSLAIFHTARTAQ